MTERETFTWNLNDALLSHTCSSLQIEIVEKDLYCRMVSWVPYAPPSCSTRGKPFPSGAFHTGLPEGQFVGAVRSWSRGEMGVGTVSRGR